MDITWTWSDDGAHVHVGGAKFELLPASGDELREWRALWVRQLWAQRRLSLADIAFSTGEIGDWTDACDRLEGLYDALKESDARIKERCAEFGTFFKPRDVRAAFGQDAQGFAKFVEDALARLSKPPPAKPKAEPPSTSAGVTAPIVPPAPTQPAAAEIPKAEGT